MSPTAVEEAVATIGAAGLRPLPSEAPHFIQYRIERQSPDELHDVEVDPLVFAHSEDRHDVGVVQPGGGLGLAMEADQDLGVVQAVASQHLQGHATAQRLLLGFVHDPHPAPADFPQQAEVPQPLQQRTDPGNDRAGDAPGDVARAWLEVFHQPEHREELADLAGQVGITLGVLLQRGSFAPPAPLEKIIGEVLDRRLIW